MKITTTTAALDNDSRSSLVGVHDRTKSPRGRDPPSSYTPFVEMVESRNDDQEETADRLRELPPTTPTTTPALKDDRFDFIIESQKRSQDSDDAVRVIEDDRTGIETFAGAISFAEANNNINNNMLDLYDDDESESTSEDDSKSEELDESESTSEDDPKSDELLDLVGDLPNNKDDEDEDDQGDVKLIQDETSVGVEAFMKNQEADLDQNEFQLQIADMCYEKGVDYWTAAEYDMSMSQLERSLAIRQDLLGRVHDDTRKTYLWLGQLQWFTMQYDIALDSLSRSLRIKSQLTNHEKQPQDYRNDIVGNWINKTLDLQGCLDKEQHWKKLMGSIQNEHNGDVLYGHGRYQPALTAYRAALMLEYSRRGVNAQTPGRPMLDAADLHFKIEKIYVKLQEYGHALLEFRQTYGVYMSVLGPNQRYTLEVAEAIVRIAYDMGYREDCGQAYVASLYKSIIQEEAGDKAMADGDFATALLAFELAMSLETLSGFGKLSTPSGILSFKLGTVHLKLQDYEASLTQFCRALGVFQSGLGSQHRSTMSAMMLLRSVTKLLL